MSNRLQNRQNDACFTASELKSDAVCADVPPRPDFRALHAELLGFKGYVRESVSKLPANKLSVEKLHQCALGDPIFIPSSPAAAADLRVQLPAEAPTPDRLTAQLGSAFQVRTTDVATQKEGPYWTLHQWSLYWEARRPLNKDAYLVHPPKLPQPVEDEADSAAVTRKRTFESDTSGQQLKGITSDCKKRLLEVLYLPTVGTPLEDQIQPPAAVRAADMLTQVWPSEAPSRPHISAFLRMSPAGAYADFRLPGGGSGMWYHLVSGAMSLALCPPTTRNLATHAAWTAAARHSAVFIAPLCEEVIRVDLKAGDTLVIPPGWLHASATAAATVSVGGHFMLKECLALHLEAGRMEEHLGVHPRARYPLFKQLMWYVAAHYSRTLQQLAGISAELFQDQVASTLQHWDRERAAAAAQAAAAADGPHADSDSVLGTSKAGTTVQRKAGQPTSVYGGVCNQTEPGVSNDNRSAILQQMRVMTSVPAVHSKPGAVPSVAVTQAVAGGEPKVGSRNRKRQRSSNFIIDSDSDESGQGRKSDEHDWHPDQDGDSGGEAPGCVAMSIEEGAHSPGEGSVELPRLRRLAAAGTAGRHSTPASQAPKAPTQGRKTTRFKGSLPAKLAAMLETFSGEDSPPNHSEVHPSSAVGVSQGCKRPHHETAATTASAHKPIRLKVKLRPLDSQPPAGSSAPGRSPRSGTPCVQSGSPRRLVVKISRAVHARSPDCNGSARSQPHEGHRAFSNGAEHPLPPTSTPGESAQTPGQEGLGLPAAQRPLQLGEQPRIPQVDGAGDEGDGDSTAAVGSPPRSPPAAAAEAAQQRLHPGDGAAAPSHRCNSSQSLGGGEPLARELQHSAREGSARASPLHHGSPPPVSDHALQQGQEGRLHQFPQRSAPPAGHPLAGDAVQAEYARMYAELEEPHRSSGDASAAQPAESGASVGCEGQQVGAGATPGVGTPLAGTPHQQKDDGGGEARQQQQQQQQQQKCRDEVGSGGAPREQQEQQQGISAAEAEGLAALLDTLKKWMAAHNALNDVPLLIRNPKEVLAGLEVSMQALGLPLIPPPHVDLEAVPLDRFCRRLKPAGTAPTTGGARPPRSLQTARTSQHQSELEGFGEEAGESMDAALDVVVEESMGPESRPEAGGSRLTGRSHPPGRHKKLSVKNRLMKKLHFK